MAHRLYRLGRFAFDHKWSVVAAWLAVLVVTGFMAVTMSKPMQDSLTIPNTPAEQARAMAAELFAGEPADAVADVTMVIGNGYVPGHAALTLDLIQREAPLREWLASR